MEQRELEVDPRLFPDMDSPRPGIHVTDLIAEIEEVLGVEREPLLFPTPATYALVGIAWEVYVRSRITECSWDIPVELDGVTGTLDALSWGREPEVVECKATWMSSNKEPRDIWRWMCQVKAYCHMVGVRTAHMYILHLCGNWKPPTPLVKEVELTFTERELEENWRMLVTHKEGKHNGG